MTAYVIKIILILVGLTLMGFTFLMFASKKLTVNLAITWGLIGLTGVAVGVVPAFSKWCFLLSEGTASALCVAAALIIWGGYEMSLLISSLLMKNQELAMQVSLLNQENEKIIRELSRLTGKSKQEL